MPPRANIESCILLLLSAAWIGLIHFPPLTPSLFVLAEHDMDENVHEEKPHLMASDFGRLRGRRGRPNKRPNKRPERPNKKPNKRPNKKPNKRPSSGGGRSSDDQKDKKKSGKEKEKDKQKNKSKNKNGDKNKGGKDKIVNDNKGGGRGGGSGGAASRSLALLASKASIIDNELFLYETPSNGWEPSSIYNHDGLSKGLKIMNSKGVAGMTYYLGDAKDGNHAHIYGLTNVAAFLAQSMKETIKYDACSENNWDLYNQGYPVSNACGQLGQSYQDYQCPKGEEHMACEVDPDMEITAITHAKWYGAPAPFYCKPKKNKDDFTGKWNHGKFCNVPWVDPPMYCEDYEGQKAGGYDHSKPVANRAGRTDVEGCCWWGRGVIQTTGPCNFGKLNYYLGARAAKEGRKPPYPSVDFCKDPEIICSSTKYKELKWMAGMFYWMESVQNYDVGGWNYMDELHKFVDGGFQDRGFIDSVSGIVNRGCHNPPCGTGAVDGGNERNANFIKTLQTFDLIESPKDIKGKGKSAPSSTGSSTSTACGSDHQNASEQCKNLGCQSALDCDGGEYCWSGVNC